MAEWAICRAEGGLWRLPTEEPSLTEMPYDLFHLYAYRRRYDSQELAISMHSDLPQPSDRTRFGKFHLWQEFIDRVQETEERKKFYHALMKDATKNRYILCFDAERYEKSDKTLIESLERVYLQDGFYHPHAEH